jgi:hypothetical protein
MSIEDNKIISNIDLIFAYGDIDIAKKICVGLNEEYRIKTHVLNPDYLVSMYSLLRPKVSIVDRHVGYPESGLISKIRDYEKSKGLDESVIVGVSTLDQNKDRMIEEGANYFFRIPFDIDVLYNVLDNFYKRK